MFPVLERHAKFRTLLTTELSTMLPLFEEVPQLLAPKMQMVLCAMRLARNEVEWYFRHFDQKPYKVKKDPKKVPRPRGRARRM